LKCFHACNWLKCAASTGVGIAGVGITGVGIAGASRILVGTFPLMSPPSWHQPKYWWGYIPGGVDAYVCETIARQKQNKQNVQTFYSAFLVEQPALSSISNHPCQAMTLSLLNNSECKIIAVFRRKKNKFLTPNVSKQKIRVKKPTGIGNPNASLIKK